MAEMTTFSGGVMLPATVSAAQMEHALRVAEGWAEDGYTQSSRDYWRGMRDTLRVLLGRTTERPTVTGPGADVAADTLLGPVPD